MEEIKGAEAWNYQNEIDDQEYKIYQQIHKIDELKNIISNQDRIIKYLLNKKE